MTSTKLRLPVLLAIMDGYGLAEPSETNAISRAHTPNLDAWFRKCPWTKLDPSGEAVGLPSGQMGNSEVGHLNMGAGRIVYQELTRIDRAICDGSFFANEALGDAVQKARSAEASVHLMGLVSDGGVHSHLDHLKALIKLALDEGATSVLIHAFLDGRDVPPKSGAGYIGDLQSFLAIIKDEYQAKEDRELELRIATVMGRYYAMDRDNRWDRIQKAWDCIVEGKGTSSASDPVQAIEYSYQQDITDEFVLPTTVGEPHPIEDGDSVVFFNFRPDRARELTRAFVDNDLPDLVRPKTPQVQFVTLTDYDPTLDVVVAFKKELPENVFADVIADHGLKQLHIAETEKYAHVTFFFNGGSETPKRGEERILIPSPHVATYDLQPEMSAPEVATELAQAIERDQADVYIVNFANCDMVGHTGSMPAAIAAVEAVDKALGKVVKAINDKGGVSFITADHGNAEKMVDSDVGGAFTAHTLSKVPLIMVDETQKCSKRLVQGGKLADIAPTLLDLIGIDIPNSWTGRSLLL